MNQIKKIYDTLLAEFGQQGWWPVVNKTTLLCEYHKSAPKNEEEALEISISAILAQNTQWHPNVVRAIQQLKLGRPFKKQELEMVRQAENLNEAGGGRKNLEKSLSRLEKSSLIGVDKIIKINKENLSRIIKSSGYHNQKAEKLKNFCEFLSGNHSGSLNTLFKLDSVRLRLELLSVNGIGPETADSIMLYAAKKPAFVIDAYTKRIFSRIGFKEKTYDELLGLFIKSLPNNEKLFNEYHALLVELGKNTCKNEPLCKKCPISAYCNYHKNDLANSNRSSGSLPHTYDSFA